MVIPSLDMTAPDFILAPVRFFASPLLLSAAHAERLPARVDITRDLDHAMALENSQTPPPGTAIWRDVLEGAVSGFYATRAGKQGRMLIEPDAAAVWDRLGEFESALKLKCRRKTITPFEEFWLTVAYDLFEMLLSVCLAGFYPCGWHHDGRICAFDPRGLEGHRPV